MDQCWVGNRDPSIRVRVRGRRIEGNQEPEQPSASRRTCSGSASPVARAHAVSLGRRLALRQPTLPRQNSLHVPNPLPTSHSSCNRASLRTSEQQARPDRMAHSTSVASHAARLERGECKSHTIATAAHHSKNNLGTVRASGFRRSTEGASENCQNGASGEVPRDVESQKRNRESVGLLSSQRNREGLLITNLRGARECPVATCCNWSKAFEILVSAAGFEPATHALKGHCSTN